MRRLAQSLTTLACLLVAAPTVAKDLRVLVSGIETAQGEIACLLFQQEKGFPDQNERALLRVTYPAVEGLLTCTFPGVEPGRYAVAVLHDENGNAKADSGMFARTEPWGVTNNVRPARRSPRFNEAAIWVSETQSSDYEVALNR